MSDEESSYDEEDVEVDLGVSRMSCKKKGKFHYFLTKLRYSN